MAARALPEALQPIFAGMVTLASLGKILKSSPTASSQFAAHGATIFEAALVEEQMHTDTRALIRIAALVRSSSLPASVRGLTSFTDFVRHETTSFRYWPPAWTLPPTQLAPGIPASTLLGMLAAHQRIECLTTACLKFYLKRFKALQPYHLQDPDYHFSSGYDEDHLDRPYIHVWQQSPPRSPSLCVISARLLGSRSSAFSGLSGVYSSSTI